VSPEKAHPSINELQSDRPFHEDFPACHVRWVSAAKTLRSPLDLMMQ
jgi:hypothetical protein